MIFYVASLIVYRFAEIIPIHIKSIHIFLYVYICLLLSYFILYLPFFLTFCHFSNCRVLKLQPDHDRQRSQLIFSSCALQKLPKRLRDEQSRSHFLHPGQPNKPQHTQNRQNTTILTILTHSDQPTPQRLLILFRYPKTQGNSVDFCSASGQVYSCQYGKQESSTP